MPERPVAIVTGGSSGIGLETCVRLERQGYAVAIVDVVERPAELPLLDPYWVVADVSEPAAVDQGIARVLDQVGPVDLLVNNAGITGAMDKAGRCHETDADEWDKVMAVNVRGPFLLSKAVLPMMLDRGHGHIITVASAAGVAAFPGRAAYTASKGAALMFAKSLAVDYGPHGIRSNAVCPGFVHTPMTDWRLQDPDLKRAIEEKIPLGQIANPGQIADAIVAMAGPDFSYMNGHALLLDGGWTAA